MAVKVPGEVYAAVTTGRVELLQPLKSALRDGSQTLDKDIAVGLIQMVEDGIVMSQEDRETMRRYVTTLEDVRRQASGLVTVIDRLRRETHEAYTGLEFDDEDDIPPAARWESRHNSKGGS